MTPIEMFQDEVNKAATDLIVNYRAMGLLVLEADVILLERALERLHRARKDELDKATEYIGSTPVRGE